MGLYEGRGNLNKGFKDLLVKWHQAREDWDDIVAQEFEKKYIEPLEMSLRTAVSAMDHMAQIMSRVDRDCR